MTACRKPRNSRTSSQSKKSWRSEYSFSLTEPKAIALSDIGISGTRMGREGRMGNDGKRRLRSPFKCFFGASGSQCRVRAISPRNFTQKARTVEP